MAARGPKPKPAVVKDQRKAVRSKREKSGPLAAAEAAQPLADDQTPATLDGSDHAAGLARGGIDGSVHGGLAPPAWLTHAGLAIWDRLAPRLIQLRLVQAPDVETFARYCSNLADWLRYRAALEEHGDTYSVTTASGLVIRPRPEFAMKDRVERMLLAYDDRFGLNPAERQRLFQSRANAPAPKAGELPLEPAKPAETAPAAPPAEPASVSPVGFLH